MSKDPTSSDSPLFIPERPLSPDELLSYDNIPLSQPFPEDILQLLIQPRLQLSSPKTGEPLEEGHLQPLSEAVVGLPVRSGEQLEAGILAETSSPSPQVEAYCPPWMPQVYHPKLSMTPRQIVRTRDDRKFTPNFIYGGDDRREFFPQGYPWSCIGRIFVWNNATNPNWNTSGTGALVGDRVVLTCGHILPVNPPPGTWKVLFVPGYFDGRSVVGTGANSWVSDFRYLGRALAKDMAVMRLYDPLGQALGYFGSELYNDDWEDQPLWTHVGYPGDIARAERPSRQFGIAVIDDDSDGDALEIEHEGDTSDGDSGGPFFHFRPDGPYIIGTHSGGERRGIDLGFLGTITLEDNNVEAGGKALNDLIRWARGVWPL
jgi:V8-like Glu-specific endopeptidase